jgi:hypothetical protein
MGYDKPLNLSLFFLYHIKGVVKRRFKMDSKKFKKMWPKVRNSVNAMGRYSSYQVRDTVRQRERAAREEQQIARREALLQVQITSLQNEVVTMRNAATNYVFSQLG